MKQSIEYRLTSFYSPSATIYKASITFCLATIASLPFIEIDISIRAEALVRPAAEVCTLRTISSGRVVKNYLHDNKRIRKGDELLVIESDGLLEQEKYLMEEIALHKEYMEDLQLLMQSTRPKELKDNSSLNGVKSFIYQQSHVSFKLKFKEALAQLNKVRQNFDRQSKLFAQRVIPSSDFETFEFELDKAEGEILKVIELQRSQWLSEFKNYQEENSELEFRLKRTQMEKEILTIRAPINGIAQNIQPIYPGNLIGSTQELGQISPDTSLIVLAYVTPNNIGLIQKGMHVKFQIDAFNYNQWGVISGKVIELPPDIEITDNKLVFEVRCSLDRDFLQLKNGHKGFLKKGMTVQCRFIVARRSLWQLLNDKTDDWIGPNQ